MGDIHNLTSLCVCPFSKQQCKGYAESAEEDSTLCLHPFHWVFPVLWMNTGSLISVSEISKHSDPGKRSWEAAAGSVPWSYVRLNATVTEVPIDFHMPQAIKHSLEAQRQHKSSVVHMTTSHRNHREQQVRPRLSPCPCCTWEHGHEFPMWERVPLPPARRGWHQAGRGS